MTETPPDDRPGSIGELARRIYESVSAGEWRRISIAAGVIGLLGDVSSVFGSVVLVGLLVCSGTLAILLAVILVGGRARGTYFPCGVSLIGVVVFATVLGIQSVTASESRGVAATFIPGIAELQTTMLNLVERVDRVGAAVEETRKEVTATKQAVDQVLEFQKDTMTPAKSQRLREALSLGNGAELADLGAVEAYAGTARALLEDQELSAEFFRRSARDALALDWFKQGLRRSIDPNMLVRRADGKFEAIIVTAFAAGNAPAVIALLEAGASPHGYQDLQLDPSPAPFFVSPLRAVLNSEGYLQGEKEDMARAMIAAGVLTPQLPELTGELKFTNDQREILEKIPERVAAELGLTVRPMAGVCESLGHGACSPGMPMADQPICDFRRTVPSIATADLHGLGEFGTIEMIGLLGVFDGTPYYLARSPGYKSEISVVAVSRDSRRWRVSKFVSPTPGLGALCEEGTSSQYQLCWLSLRLGYDPAAKRLEVMERPFTTRYCPA